MAGKRYKVTTRDGELTGVSCGLKFKDGVAIHDILQDDVRALNGLENACSIHGAHYELLGELDENGEFTPIKKKEAAPKEPAKKEDGKKAEAKK